MSETKRLSTLGEYSDRQAEVIQSLNARVEKLEGALRRKIAYEPIGFSDASDRELLDGIVTIAKAALAAAEAPSLTPDEAAQVMADIAIESLNGLPAVERKRRIEAFRKAVEVAAAEGQR